MSLVRMLLLVTIGCAPTRAGEKAYMLIDAVAFPETDAQPTWIALHRVEPGYALIHVPVGRGIVELEPGKYRIAHVDFQKEVEYREQTTEFVLPGQISYEVASQWIAYVGLVKIRRDESSFVQPWTLRIQIISSADVVSWACDSEPEVMKRFPVRVVTDSNDAKLMRVRCET